MPEKDERICATEHVMASLPTRAWQPSRVIGPSLRLRPNFIHSGGCSQSARQLCPSPAPANN